MKYVLSRMEWNPDFDIEAAQKEYCRLMYGAASEPVEKLYFLLRERWDSVPKYTIRTEDAYERMYPPEVIAQIKSLLDKAKNCVPKGSVERLRVDFFARGFDEFFINAKAIQSRTKVQMQAGQRMEAIVIDGIPAEQGWRHSDKTTMRNVFNGISCKSPTECQAAYDSEALYLLFVMKDDHPDKLVANSKKRNGAVFRDDSVEILIMPGKNSPNYYQLVVNPAATIYAAKYTKDSDSYKKREPWAAENMTHIVKIRKDGWILEVKIPWKDLGVSQPKVGDEWPVNLVRNKMTVPRESQSVSMTLGHNHIVDRWGTLKFAPRGF
jgi:cellulose/xylan binding protein with CBM9 domain